MDSFDTLGRWNELRDLEGACHQGTPHEAVIRAWALQKAVMRGQSKVTFQDEPRSTQSVGDVLEGQGRESKIRLKDWYMVAWLNRNDETGLKVQIFEGAISKEDRTGLSYIKQCMHA